MLKYTKQKYYSEESGGLLMAKYCKVVGCKKLALSKGYCSKHYQQMRRHGGLTLEREQQHQMIPSNGKCVVDGCDRAVEAKGMCKLHYNIEYRKNRFHCSVKGCENVIYKDDKCKKHYDAFVNDKDDEGVCKVKGCNEERYSNGYCLYHYKQKVTDTETIESTKLDLDEICSIEGCGGKKYSGGVCKSCYSRYRRYGYLIDINGNKITGLDINLKICKVDGCNELVVNTGYCSKHYGQYKVHGKVVNTVEDLNVYCSTDGCNEIALRDGLCKMHYEHIRNYGRVLRNPLIREVLPKPIQKFPKTSDLSLVKNGVIDKVTVSRFQHTTLRPQRILVLGDINIENIKKVVSTIDTAVSTYFKNERIELLHLIDRPSRDVIETIAGIREFCLMDIDLNDPESVIKTNSDIIDCCDMVLYFANIESENDELIDMVNETNMRGFKIKI